MFFESIRKRMAGIVFFIAAAFVVTLLYTGLGDTTQQVQAGTTVAYVNGKEITDLDVENQLYSILQSGFTGGLSNEQLRFIAFQDLANYHLVVDAARDEGFEVEKAEVDAWIESALPEGVTLRQVLAQYGMTERELRQEIEEYLLVVKVEDARRNEVTVDEAEVEERFEEMLASGDFNQVRARHILIRPVDPSDEASWEAALQQIEDLRQQILDGAAFEQIAAEQSHDTGSAILGGDLGFFGRGQMVQPFEEAAFSLEIGEISEPVESSFGYHLIEVTAKRDLTDPTYAESEKNRIREGLLGQVLQQHMAEWIDELWNKGNFEYLDIRLHAQHAFREGDLETSARLFEDAVQQNPNNASLNMLLAEVYEGLEKPEEALEQYRAAVQKSPSDVNLQLTLGLALLQAGENEEAESVLVLASELAAVQVFDPYQSFLTQLQVQQALTQLGADDDILAAVDERIRAIVGDPGPAQDVPEVDLDEIVE